MLIIDKEDKVSKLSAFYRVLILIDTVILCLIVNKLNYFQRTMVKFAEVIDIIWGIIVQ